jgi:hypothetical protein
MAKTKTKSEKKNAAVQTVTMEQHLQALEILRERCYEMHFTIGRLPTSRRADAKNMAKIANFVNGSTKSVRTQWRMFLDTHPKVKELNSAISELEQYRDSFLRSYDGSDKDFTDGKRVIWAEDHHAIVDEVIRRAKRIDELAAEVQAALPEIKAIDREAAGSLWQESAYPDDVRTIVGVPKDAFGDYIITFHPMTVIAPALRHDIAMTAARRAEEKLNDTLSRAVENVVTNLVEQLRTFASELDFRQMLDPVEGHSLLKFAQHGPIELVRMRDHTEDNQLGEDEVMLCIAYKETGTGEQLDTVRRWVGPYSKAEVEQKLRPYKTEQKRKLYPSVVENIIKTMERFREVQKQILGAHGENIERCFGELFAMLQNLGKQGDDAARQAAQALREGETVRQTVQQLVGETIDRLGEAVDQVRKVRRKLNLPNQEQQ